LTVVFDILVKNGLTEIKDRKVPIEKDANWIARLSVISVVNEEAKAPIAKQAKTNPGTTISAIASIIPSISQASQDPKFINPLL